MEMGKRIVRAARRARDAMARPVLAAAGLAVFWCTGAVAQSPTTPASGPAPVPAASSTPGAIGSQAFFRDPDYVDALLSPNGKRLAITSAKGGGRTALFVVDVAKPTQLTLAAQFGDADVVHVHWLDDERLLFGASNFSEGSGRNGSGPGLFIANHDGSDMHVLITRKIHVVVDGSMKNRPLDGYHRLLQIPMAQEGVPNDEIIVGQYHETSYEDYTLTPMWLNVKTGRTRDPGFDVPRGVRSWMFDHKGEPRVAFTRDKDRQAAHWRGPGSTHWQQIVEGNLLEMAFTPHTVDDAGNLYVTRKEGVEGYEVLVPYDFARKAPAAKALVSTPGFDFDGSLIVEPGVSAAQGVRVITDGETTVWFDAEHKRLQTLIDARLPGRINRITCRQCGKAQAIVLVNSYSDHDPGHLYLFYPTPPAGQSAWVPVIARRPDIDPRRMAGVDFQRIKARDGRDLPVWITAPVGAEPGKPAPTVVLVHGGPWVRGRTWGWDGESQFLASRGYLVIEPEFRGSTGYGDAHLKASWKQWGQTMQDDVADALLWAQKQGLASDRACIAGASYGGYSTLMGLVRHPQLYRCGAAWVAATDLELYLKGSWWFSDDISDVARKYTIPDVVGDMDKDAGLINANSPVLLADKIKAPLFLAFGEDDVRVPLAHGKRMREALQKQGREPEWVSYAGEGHGWGKLETRLDFAQRLEQFLAKHLHPEQTGVAQMTTKP